MVFDAKAIEEAAEFEDFEFTDLDGKPHSLPNLKSLRMDFIEQFEEYGTEIFEELNADAYTAIQKMQAGTVEKLVESYVDHSGVEGKEPTKPPRAQRRAKRRK